MRKAKKVPADRGVAVQEKYLKEVKASSGYLIATGKTDPPPPDPDDPNDPNQT